MKLKSIFFDHDRRRSGSGASGMSLLEILIVLGLTGGVALLLNTIISAQLKSAKMIESALAQQSIRSIIIKTLSCERTIGVTPPMVDTLLDLLNNKGNVIGNNLVSGSDTDFDGARQIFGDYYYKAFYRGNRGIEVQLAKKKSNSSSWEFDQSIGGSETYDFTYAAANPLIGGSNVQYPLCAGSMPGKLQFLTVSPTMREIGRVVYAPGEIPDYYRPPKSNPNSMLRYASCINLTADIATNTPTGIAASSLVQYPMYLMFSCTKYCRKIGFASGWVLGCETFRNTNGTLVFFGQSAAYYARYNKGVTLTNLDEMAPCSCVK